jgi:DNA-binding transcriptional regulator YhcF (GntR family)
MLLILVEGLTRQGQSREIDIIENMIKKRISVGSSVSYKGIVRELVENRGVNENLVMRSIDIMTQQGRLLFKNQRKTLVRLP